MKYLVRGAKIAGISKIDSLIYESIWGLAINDYTKEQTAPQISVTPGGIPIKSNSRVFLGAIGVSGALSAVDVKCAEAGIKRAGKF